MGHNLWDGDTQRDLRVPGGWGEWTGLSDSQIDKRLMVLVMGLEEESG